MGKDKNVNNTESLVKDRFFKGMVVFLFFAGILLWSRAPREFKPSSEQQITELARLKQERDQQLSDQLELRSKFQVSKTQCETQKSATDDLLRATNNRIFVIDFSVSSKLSEICKLLVEQQILTQEEIPIWMRRMSAMVALSTNKNPPPAPLLYFFHIPYSSEVFVSFLKDRLGDQLLWLTENPKSPSSVKILPSTLIVGGYLGFGFQNLWERTIDFGKCFIHLRNPMEQILLEYMLEVPEQDISLPDWIKNRRQNNLLTIMLSGVSPKAWWNSNEKFPFIRPTETHFIVTQEYYALARKNLMENVILLENRYLDSLVVMKRFLPEIPTQFLSHSKFQDSLSHLHSFNVSDEDRAVIQFFNRWDFKLYELATSLFNQQILLTV